MEPGMDDTLDVAKMNDVGSISDTSVGDASGQSDVIENGYDEQVPKCEPREQTSSCDEWSSTSDVDDDEWRPSPKKRPRKTTSIHGSQAARRRRRIARPIPGTTSGQRDAFSVMGDVEKRYPLCWSDTTLGSAVAEKVKSESDTSPLPGYDFQGSRMAVCKKALPHKTGSDEVWKGRPNKCTSLRSGPHRACRPTLLQDNSQSDDEDFQRSEKHLKLRRNGTCSFKTERILPVPKSRPRLLQKKPVEECHFSDDSQCCPPEPAPVHHPLPKLRASGPRMLSRGNYVMDRDTKESSDRLADTTEVTRCSRKKKLSLAAKQRWERRRAKNGALNGQAVHCTLAPPCESCLPKSINVKATFVLPAKLRWKWKNGCSQHCSYGSPNEFHRIALEDQTLTGVKKEVFSMPAKLRWKHEQTAQGGGGSVESPPGHLQNLSIVEATPNPQEDRVNKRSHAKKLWWQRMKTFTAESTLGQTPIPKFLQAELFPNIRMKRRKSLSARSENQVAEVAEPSRRSLAMKENWRKRKQAWIQAAAKSVAALTATPSNLAADITSLVELGSTSELAGNMFLAQCSAEMSLLESTRGRTSSRHYNTKGIHITSNRDVCDCLNLSCPGCHYPCPKCRSPKCGHECRCSRHFSYEQIEIEGTDIVIKNPLL